MSALTRAANVANINFDSIFCTEITDGNHDDGKSNRKEEDGLDDSHIELYRNHHRDEEDESFISSEGDESIEESVEVQSDSPDSSESEAGSDSDSDSDEVYTINKKIWKPHKRIIWALPYVEDTA